MGNEFLAVGVPARVNLYSCRNINAPELVAHSVIDEHVTDMVACAWSLAVTSATVDGLSAITLFDLQGSSSTGCQFFKVGVMYMDQVVEAVPAGPGLLATMGEFDGGSLSVWSFADGPNSPKCMFSDTD